MSNNYLTLETRAAFLEAYDSVGPAPHSIVAEFVDAYIADATENELYEIAHDHYSQLRDCVGMFEAGMRTVSGATRGRIKIQIVEEEN